MQTNPSPIHSCELIGRGHFVVREEALVGSQDEQPMTSGRQ